MVNNIKEVLFEDLLTTIPPAEETFAEMAQDEEAIRSGNLVEGVDYDLVRIPTSLLKNHPDFNGEYAD